MTCSEDGRLSGTIEACDGIEGDSDFRTAISVGTPWRCTTAKRDGHAWGSMTPTHALEGGEVVIISQVVEDELYEGVGPCGCGPGGWWERVLLYGVPMTRFRDCMPT